MSGTAGNTVYRQGSTAFRATREDTCLWEIRRWKICSSSFVLYGFRAGRVAELYSLCQSHPGKACLETIEVKFFLNLEILVFVDVNNVHHLARQIDGKHIAKSLGNYELKKRPNDGTFVVSTEMFLFVMYVSSNRSGVTRTADSTYNHILAQITANIVEYLL